VWRATVTGPMRLSPATRTDSPSSGAVCRAVRRSLWVLMSVVLTPFVFAPTTPTIANSAGRFHEGGTVSNMGIASGRSLFISKAMRGFVQAMPHRHGASKSREYLLAFSTP
jgi:hypothetical protein